MFGIFIFILIGAAMLFRGLNDDALKIAVIVFCVFMAFALFGMMIGK